MGYDLFTSLHYQGKSLRHGTHLLPHDTLFNSLLKNFSYKFNFPPTLSGHVIRLFSPITLFQIRSEIVYFVCLSLTDESTSVPFPVSYIFLYVFLQLSHETSVLSLDDVSRCLPVHF